MSRRAAPVQKRNRSPPSISSSPAERYEPDSPASYREVDPKRRLSRTGAFHPQVKEKRSRDYHDRNREREEERPRERIYYQGSSETETDEPEYAPKLVKKHRSRRHDRSERSYDRQQRKEEKAVGDPKAPPVVPPVPAAQAVQAVPAVPAVPAPDLQTMFSAFLQQLPQQQVAQLLASSIPAPLIKDGVTLPAISLSTSHSPGGKIEGLVAMPEAELSQSTNCSDLLYQGQQICDEFEDAYSERFSHLTIKGEYSHILRKFSPVSQTFEGAKIGQQMSLWGDAESTTRKRAEKNFRETASKIATIQTRMASAIACIQPGEERKQVLVQSTSGDLKRLRSKQEKELNTLRGELDLHDKEFLQDAYTIPDQREMEKEANLKAIKMLSKYK